MGQIDYNRAIMHYQIIKVLINFYSLYVCTYKGKSNLISRKIPIDCKTLMFFDIRFSKV